jgi:hypothetical protein
MADELDATPDTSYGGGQVVYRFGEHDNLSVTVLVERDGSGFAGYATKYTEYCDEFITEFHTAPGTNRQAAEQVMLDALLEAHEDNRDAYLWETYSFYDSEDSLKWDVTGFSPEDAQKWQDAGFEPVEAKPWREANFDPDEMKDWKEHGFESVSTEGGYTEPYADQWRSQYFDASEAEEWHGAGFRWAEDAREWRDAGFDSDSAVEWLKMQIGNSNSSLPVSTECAGQWHKITPDPIEALKWINVSGSTDPEDSANWRSYGFSADERDQWYQFDPEEARAKIDAGISFETAEAERDEAEAERIAWSKWELELERSKQDGSR